MKEKTLKWSIYALGILCFFCLVAVRFEILFNSALKEPVVPNYWDKTKYGELYYFSMIKHFREEGLPPAKQKFEHSEKQASIEDCDILIFGDSFFEISRNKQIPERIADEFGVKVHFVNNDFPLNYLAQNNYSDTTPKLVFFERVERYIPIAFQHPHVQDFEETPQPHSLVKLYNYILEKVFYPSSEELLDAMLKRSYLTTDLYQTISTVKFDAFGYISKLTPKYHVEKNNSWLFYHDQVNETRTSFYYQHSKETMDSICNNIANLATDLKHKYNMEFMFLPLPAKYTITHEIINNDEYNNFLPQLYECLEERNIPHLELYSSFKQSDSTLYYRTDGHWNKQGIELAYKKLIPQLEAMLESK